MFASASISKGYDSEGSRKCCATHSRGPPFAPLPGAARKKGAPGRVRAAAPQGGVSADHLTKERGPMPATLIPSRDEGMFLTRFAGTPSRQISWNNDDNLAAEPCRRLFRQPGQRFVLPGKRGAGWRRRARRQCPDAPQFDLIDVARHQDMRARSSIAEDPPDRQSLAQAQPRIGMHGGQRAAEGARAAALIVRSLVVVEAAFSLAHRYRNASQRDHVASATSLRVVTSPSSARPSASPSKPDEDASPQAVQRVPLALTPSLPPVETW